MTYRRLVKRDHVRELLHVSHVNDSTCLLLAVTHDQLEILRVLARYAHRRINWNDEDVDSQHYYLPDEEAWDEICNLVDDLENRLMDTCNLCDLTDALENLLCICDALDKLNLAVSLDVGLTGALPVLEDQYPTEEDAETIDTVGLPETDLELCQLANTIWGWGTEVILEKLVPIASDASDKLALAITATELFMLITGGIGLVPAVAIALFTSIVKWLADGMIANLSNWISGSGQEGVCALYAGFVDGGWPGARANLAEMIDNEVQLSPGDKAVLKWFLTLDYVMKAVQYSIDSDLLQPDDYFSYSCTDCEPSAGCINFDDEDWTLTAIAALQSDGSIIITGNTGQVAASRAFDVSTQGRLWFDYNPPDLAPPAFGAFGWRSTLAASEVDSGTISTDDNARQWSGDTAAGEADQFEIRAVSGTVTRIYRVCFSMP